MTLGRMDVRAAVAWCGRRQQGLARRQDLMRAGVATASLSRAVRDGEVVRLRRAVYALEPPPPWPVFAVTADGVSAAYVQHVRAALLSLGPSATAAGLTAACLRGWGLLHEPVWTLSVAVPHGRSRTRMARVRAVQRRAVTRELLPVVPGCAPLRVTTAVATVLDCCRELPLLDAVVLCDSALRSGQVRLEELERAARRLPGRRHAARVRRALALCDPESGSVLESVLRVLMVQDGITGFATQRVLFDAHGRRLHRVDFCFAAARLVVEADGARWHDGGPRDQWLDNRLAAAGWRVLRLRWAEVVHDPQAALALIRAALAAGCSDIQLPASLAA